MSKKTKEDIMQINHLEIVKRNIKSWLTRSTRSATLKNEGFLVNDGSCYASRRTVSFFEGHGNPYSILLQSEGMWSDNESKEMWITSAPKQKDIPGFHSEHIPRIILKKVFEEIERYLPLPEWCNNSFIIIHWKNYVLLNQDGSFNILNEEQWENKYIMGIDPNFDIHAILKEIKRMADELGIKDRKSVV